MQISDIVTLILSGSIIFLSLTILNATLKYLRVSELRSQAELIRVLKQDHPKLDDGSLAPLFNQLTKRNNWLVGTVEGRKELTDFFVSEVKVSAYLNELEEAVSLSENYTQFKESMNHRVNVGLKEDDGIMTKFKKAATPLVGKLFDKVNKLVFGGKT